MMVYLVVIALVILKSLGIFGRELAYKPLMILILMMMKLTADAIITTREQLSYFTGSVVMIITTKVVKVISL